MTILPLRERAKELFGAAVAAADPSRAVRHHLITPLHLLTAGAKST